MLKNDLINKIKNLDKMLEDELKGADTILANAKEKIKDLEDPALKELSEDVLRRASNGEKINVEAYLKQAMSYANGNSSTK